MGNLIAFDKEIIVFEVENENIILLMKKKELSNIIDQITELNPGEQIRIKKRKILESDYYNLPEFEGY